MNMIYIDSIEYAVHGLNMNSNFKSGSSENGTLMLYDETLVQVLQAYYVAAYLCSGLYNLCDTTKLEAG